MAYLLLLSKDETGSSRTNSDELSLFSIAKIIIASAFASPKLK